MDSIKVNKISEDNIHKGESHAEMLQMKTFGEM
jgi:hypothetical protein